MVRSTHAPAIMRRSLAACAIGAGLLGPSAWAATETHWGGELRIDEQQPNALSQTFGGDRADASKLYSLDGPNGMQGGATLSAWLNPYVEATMAPSLRAWSSIGYSLPTGWRSLRGRAWTSASADDVVRVMFLGGTQPGSYTLEYQFHVNGRFRSSIEGLDPSLDLQYMNYRYYTSADFFANWRRSSVPGSKNDEIYFNEMYRFAAQGDFVMGQTLIPLGEDGFGPGYLYPQANHKTDEYDVPPELRYTLTMPYSAGDSLSVNFTLNTVAVMTLENVDFVGVKGDLESSFQHTVTLDGVRLRDAAGHVVTTPWSLQSENGIDYTELYTEMPAVPEPASAALLALGAAALAGAQRRVRRNG